MLIDVLHLTWRQGRRLVVIVIGTTVVLVGIALLVLPGPAFIVIPAGLAILATELIWARRLLLRIKQQTQEFGEMLIGRQGNGARPPAWGNCGEKPDSAANADDSGTSQEEKRHSSTGSSSVRPCDESQPHRPDDEPANEMVSEGCPNVSP